MRRYGKWGYQFARAPFSIQRVDYQRAVQGDFLARVLGLSLICLVFGEAQLAHGNKMDGQKLHLLA